MPGKLVTAAWMFGAIVGWGVLRTDPGWSAGGLAEGLLLLLVLLPVIRSMSDPGRMLWLLGLSASVGAVPEWSGLPAIRGLTHLVVALCALRLFVGSSGATLAVRSPGEVLGRLGGAGICAGLFLLVAFAGIAVNAGARGAAGWELKAGLYGIVVLGSAFCVVLFLNAGRVPGRGPLAEMVDGFAWGAIFQATVLMLAAGAVFGAPLMSGNDTALGLAYWDRIKGILDGPDQAGMYLVASVPLLLLWKGVVRGQGAAIAASAYVQLAPWLVVLTGSRTARLALAVVLLGLIAHPRSRRTALAVLPSAAAALTFGSVYQSPRAMLSAFLDMMSVPSADLLPPGNTLEGMSFVGRILADERWSLMAEGLRWLGDRPLWQLLLGAGLGVGGYSAREYPTMHNALDLVVETGLLGTGVLLAMLAVLLRRLLGGRAGGGPGMPSGARPLLGIALTGLMVGAMSYEEHMWGVTIVLLVMCLAAVGPGEAACHEGPGTMGTRAVNPSGNVPSGRRLLRRPDDGMVSGA